MFIFDEKTVSVLFEDFAPGIVRHCRQNREIMARPRQPSGEIGQPVLRSSRLWWIVLSQNQNVHDGFPGARLLCAKLRAVGNHVDNFARCITIAIRRSCSAGLIQVLQDRFRDLRWR
jgi:hypothetical protein